MTTTLDCIEVKPWTGEEWLVWEPSDAGDWVAHPWDDHAHWARRGQNMYRSAVEYLHTYSGRHGGVSGPTLALQAGRSEIACVLVETKAEQ
jgi:hypothetical protein